MTATAGTIAQARDAGRALLHMTPAQLDEAYAAGETGPIPNGRARGYAVLFPKSGLAPILGRIAPIVWQGKIFNAESGRLVNRVFGLHLIPAKLYHGESWFDDGDAVIVDYKDTSLSYSRVRDEIRCIAPHFWLGRTYYRTGDRGKYVLSFGLDFRG